MSASKVAVILLRFAKSRENALRAAGALNLAKAEAIQRIKNVCGYFSTVPEQKQINAIRQIESELIMILPSEQSRFKKLRESILNLIDLSHA